jgi:hypothetical protein
MAPRYATVAELRRAISTEILVAAGVPRRGPLQTVLSPLVRPPADRFAHLAAEFDRRVALDGWTAAVRWVLPRFVDGTHAHGSANVPATGPLVVASNHPGSYDSLVIASALARDDLKILVSDVPFLRNLHATSSHFIYTPNDPHSRLMAFRESVRHLRAGGALLVFATGVVDPDPALRSTSSFAVLPDAQEALQRWSPSLALFLRAVPEAGLLPTIVSGVLAPSCLRHPLTRLRQGQQQKQFLAEFLQVTQQLLFSRRFGLRPTVRFGTLLTVAALDGGHDAQAIPRSWRPPSCAVAAIIQQAQLLLAQV